MCDLAREYLQDDSMSIFIATSVLQALTLLEERSFDAIVCDYQMSEMNGIEFLQQLRSRNNRIPFILFTGKGREEIAMQALNHGADYYLKKDGDLESLYGELAHIIKRVVRYRRTARTLFLSEERQRTVLDSIEDGYYEADLEGRITFVNRSVTKMLGYTGEELVGKDYTDIVDSTTATRVHDGFDEVYRTKQPKKVFDLVINRKNGTRGVFETSISLVNDLNSIITGFRGIMRDVTGRKNAEALFLKEHVDLKNGYQQLQQSHLELSGSFEETRQQYTNLVELLYEGVLLEDKDGFISFVNRRLAEKLGYTKDELLGKHWTFIVPKEHVEMINQFLAQRPGGTSNSYEATIITKDGNHVPVIISAAALFSPSGIYRGVLSVFTDITGYTKMEKNSYN